MKTKFHLLIIIIGIISIDISCNIGGGDGCPEEHYDILGIKAIRPLKIDTRGQINTLSKDSVKFDSLIYEINFEGKQLVSNKGFSLMNMAYAEPCPISLNVDWELDSIKVFSVVNSVKTDVTDQFYVSGRYSPLKKINNSDPRFFTSLFSDNYSAFNLLFSLATPPSKTDNYQFNFQFFDKKGRIYEKMSEPLIISP